MDKAWMKKQDIEALKTKYPQALKLCSGHLRYVAQYSLYKLLSKFPHFSI